MDADMTASFFRPETWKTEIGKILRHWLFEVDTTSMELFSAVELMVLGMFLLLPINTFGTSSVYDFIFRIAPEETWGIVMLAVGFMQIYGLNTPPKGIRRTTSIIAACIYGLWAGGLIISNWASTATVTYSLLTLSMIWANVNRTARAHAKSGRS